MGYVVFEMRDEEIFVAEIHIEPAFQSKGIGAEILNKFYIIQKEENKLLSLNVLKSNPRAKQFYEREGFSQIGENDNKYFMQKKVKTDV